MPRIIQQTVTLSAAAERLFDMYLAPKIHEAITGAPVTIGPEEDLEFRAFHGMIFGRMLYIVPKRLIVQTWRAAHWKNDDLDSTLVLTFWPEGENGRIELVHVNVADHDYDDVNRGWETHYWNPWREYLKKGR